MGSLGIAIDGGRYIRVESSLSDISRTVRLRTMRPGQDAARLDFCVFRRNGPQLRKSVVLKGLSAEVQVPSELRLSIERRNFSLWTVNLLKPDGTREIIRVRTGIGLWPLIVIAVGLIFLGLWILLPRISVPSEKYAAAADTANVISSGNDLTDTPDIEPSAAPSALPPTEKLAAVDPEPELEPDAALLPGTVIIYFQAESAVISNTARDDLNKLSDLLADNISIEIGGHCANYGTERGRWALSRARADTVADYLSGIISPTVNVEVKAFGGFKPLNRDPELQDRNRRVEIIVSGGDE